MFKVYRNFGHHIFSDGLNSRDYTTGSIFHVRSELFEDNSFLVGGEFRRQGGEVLSGGIVGDYSKDEFAFFFHDEQKLFENKVIVNSGVRYHEDSSAGSIVAPSGGIVWHIVNGTSIRALCERGFRMPHLNELRFLSISNPDLKPETSWNYEWGLNHQITDNLNFDFVYFFMEAKDFIRLSAGRLRNIDKVEFRGIETGIEYILSENFRTRLSFTHLRSGRYTQGRPENEVDITLRYKKDKFKFSLIGQGVCNYFSADDKQQAIPDFFVIATKISYDISSSFAVYLGIDNIFNVEHKVYVDLPGAQAGVYTQPMRSFLCGAIYKW
jgi:outer membrane receptor protein involved in Fe transport